MMAGTEHTVPLDVVSAQIKPRKADYAANLARIGDLFEQLAAEPPMPDVLVLPETVLSGYFLEGGVREAARGREQVFADLLALFRDRIGDSPRALDVVLGFYELYDGKCYNAAMYATLTSRNHGGCAPGILHVHHKFFLPTYGVFDEKRFVARGRTIDAFDTRNGRVAILICEDIWHSVTGLIAALKGAHIIYVVSASPGREFEGDLVGNLARWRLLLQSVAEEHCVFIVYSGLVGFEGGKGFTGTSRILDPWGRTLVEGPTTEEAMVRARITREDVAIARAASPLLADVEATLSDLVLELDAVARKPHQI